MQLRPFDPEHVCPACGMPGGAPERHRRPVLIVFGRAPQYPCGGEEGQDLGDHMCVKCSACQHNWMETAPVETDS